MKDQKFCLAIAGLTRFSSEGLTTHQPLHWKSFSPWLRSKVEGYRIVKVAVPPWMAADWSLTSFALCGFPAH